MVKGEIWMFQKWLAELEQEYKIDILLACETGSRAWGTATEESDHDIRFIYKYKDIRSYLSLSKALEILDFPTPFDAHGWDIFKTFYLFSKSNPGLLEITYSPVVIKKDENFLSKLRDLMKNNYSLFSLSQHYIHLMRRNMKEIKRQEFNYKRQKQLIQATRSLLIARAIHKEQDIPDRVLYTNFHGFFSKEDKLVSCYNLLIEAKQTGKVIDLSDIVDIVRLLEEEMQILDGEASQLPTGNNIRDVLDEWLWELLHI